MTDAILFKEKETDFVYEVHLFDDHVLVRPASRDFESVIENLNYSEFSDRFDEFWGHSEEYLMVTVTRH